MMIIGCKVQAVYCLLSVMGFYCFLTGSAGPGAQPAVRMTLVLWTMTGDACIPLYIVISYDRTLIIAMCVSTCVRVNHVRVTH